jgi:hypothetical protein
MYKVVPIEDIPSSYPCKRDKYKWVIVEPYISGLDTCISYKLKNDARGIWHKIVSKHPTKGAADKAYNKLFGKKQLPKEEANNKPSTKGAADKAYNKLFGKKQLPKEEVNNKPYHLAMTERQAQVIINALELYSRIGMGQLQEITYVLRMNSVPGSIDFNALDKIADLTRKASSYWMKGSGGYHGISSDKINDSFRVAWDLQQVIRYRLAWDRNPDGGIQVNFDDPYKTSSVEDLAVIKKVL